MSRHETAQFVPNSDKEWQEIGRTIGVDGTTAPT